jgi:hypothetical protein
MKKYKFVGNPSDYNDPEEEGYEIFKGSILEGDAMPEGWSATVTSHVGLYPEDWEEVQPFTSINSGDVFICVLTSKDPNFYTTGAFYTSENKNCITDNNGDKKHSWSIDKANEYFVKVSENPILTSPKEEVVKSNKAMRFNEGKPQWSLVHFNSLIPFVKVLEFGAEKYSRDNWMKDMELNIILDSAQRHLAAMMDGEELDQESGLSHAGHVMCNMMFYTYHLNKNGKKI